MIPHKASRFSRREIGSFRICHQSQVLSGSDRSFIPDGMKEMEVMYLNKLYKGYGVKNVNGGLEFYSPIVNTYHRQYLENYYSDLARRQDSVMNEIIDICLFLRHWQPIFDMLQADRRRCQVKLGQYQADMKTFCSSVHSMTMSGHEKKKRLSVLWRNISHLKRTITHDDFLLSTLAEKKCRLFFLRNILLPQITCELQVLSSRFMQPYTYTIGTHGIIAYPSDTPTRICCIFSSLSDYMAYKSLVDAGKIPFAGDCYIISAGTVMNTLKDFSRYASINGFFPSTIYGRTLDRLFSDTFGNSYIGKAQNFRPCVSLFQYARRSGLRTTFFS